MLKFATRTLSQRSTVSRAALVFGCLFAAAPAYAQGADAPPSEAEEIVVTGFRQSLESALNQKRSENSAIDAIKAEDIADFPDANLAESLQRVPGVSINRVGGEGRSITVRGLGSGFTRVRVNGMEAQAISGATTSDRGANTGRGFDFNVFASELFSNLTVRKTADAETIEGSLGATVDLNIARPFDFKEFTFALNAQGGYNTLSQDISPKLSGLIANSWEGSGGRFGIMASAAWSSRHYLEDQFGSGGWNPASTTDGGLCSPVGTIPQNPADNPATGTDAANCAAGVPRPPAGDAAYAAVNQPNVFLPRLPRYGRFVHDQDRLGLAGAIQWESSDGRIELGLDALYSRLKATREESWLEGFSFARAISQFGKPQTAVRVAELREAGQAVTAGVGFPAGTTLYDIAYGEFDGVDVRSDTQHDEFDSTFTQYTLHGRFDATDRLKFTGKLGLATTDYNQTRQTTIMFQRPNAGLTIDFRDSLDQPTITHDFDVTDSSLYTFGTNNAEVRMAPFFVDNKNKMAELNAAWEVSDAVTLKAGGHYDRFDFEIRSYMRPNNFLVPNLSAAELADVTRLVTDFGDGLREGAFHDSWATIDYDKFVDAYNIYDNAGMFTLVENLSAHRKVRENIASAYAQVDFNLEGMGIPVRGNAGLRYAHTALRSTGYSAALQQLIDAKHSYDDWLPSANIVIEPTDTLIVRLAAAKVMSRPEFGFLNPAATVVASGTPSINGGNPALKPIRANTFDAAVEWYFGRNSLLSAAFFYKDIKSYIQNQAQQLTYNQTGLPLELIANSNLDPNVTLFTVNQPINTPGGPLKGFEINYQQAFDFLPGPLANTGALFNYTHVKSRITYILPASTPTNLVTTRNDLIGLSQDAFNATLYYEDSKFAARISGAYRSPYIIAIPANNPSQDLEGVDKSLVFDLSASYQINEHVKVTLEGLNIFDRFYRQYIDSVRDSTFVYTHTGAQYYLGVQYKF